VDGLMGVWGISTIFVAVGDPCPCWGLHANKIKTIVNAMMEA